MKTPDPVRPTDDEARALAAELLGAARFAALGTLRDGAPMVTRVACLWLPGLGPATLVSDLSEHARMLASDPRCSLLVGEPGPRGDPLTHPRITLLGRAERADKAAHREGWLAAIPKAGLYYDFTDFRLWSVAVGEAHLNGGFGRAYRLGPEDLPPPLGKG
jgi:putative heme iron utilization protein